MPRQERERPLPTLEEALSYSTTDTKRVTGWHDKQLYDELKAGKVKSYTIGRRRYIEAASLRARIAELVAAASPIRPEARFVRHYHRGRDQKISKDGRQDGRQAPQISKTLA